jgi:hypothetical protein
MSGTDPKLDDGNLPPEEYERLRQEELYDEDEEDVGPNKRNTWEDICILSMGPYTVEYDPYTKELTITGGQLMDIDCLGDEVSIKEVQYCRTVIFHPSE